MKIGYRNPALPELSHQWNVFQDRSKEMLEQLRQFGFQIDDIRWERLSKVDTYKFCARYINADRIISLSLITNKYQDGAVSMLVYPRSSTKRKFINIYKYLRKHFGMVNRKSLFLNRYHGDFSERLQKVFYSYARFSQFYFQSILQGILWEDYAEEETTP